MQKYKLMLILPFVILIIAAWGSLGSKDEEIERLLNEQQELISTADKLAEDQVYSRAAQVLEEALALKVGDTESIESTLMEYYFADGNYSRWISLQTKRIKNASASEEDILKIIEYYQNKKDYDEMLDMINAGLKLFPQSEKITYLRDSLIYSYSYKKYDYQAVAPIFDGRIAVFKDGKWGYASYSGANPGEFLYDSAASFCGDHAAVDDGEAICLITSKLKRYSVCHDKSVDGVFLYDGSRTVVKAAEKYMLANDEMEIVSEAYDFIGSVSEKMRPARKDGKWFFINDNGKKVNSNEYDGIALNNKYSAFCGGIAFASEGGAYKMINTEGETVNESTFEDAYPFIEENSLAAVKKNGKWGFADNTGEIVIPCTYDSAKSFSYGLAAVQTNGKWGYINRSGESVIPAEYDSAEPFENKQAVVLSGDICGFIYLDYYQ